MACRRASRDAQMSNLEVYEVQQQKTISDSTPVNQGQEHRLIKTGQLMIGKIPDKAS